MTISKLDKIVVITGGASGIGLACAVALQAQDYQPFLLDLQQSALASACDQLGLNADTHSAVVDVSDEVSVETLLAEKLSTLNLVGLVNSAGIAADTLAIDTQVEDFTRILNVNLVGSFIMAKALAKHWLAKQQKGSIVNISSISGLTGNKGRSAYGASKAAINNLTQVMSTELAPQGIRVNAVAPGPIDTPLAQRMHTAHVRQQWQNRVSMGRYGTPEEVAKAVRFLISAEASYINGQIIAVDGGFMSTGLVTE